ncbi:MAG: hypothetical protein HQ478_12365 [Chloroflexi bacterium]|nr:hypothetical protein [Chloroflexota bacterium]
MKLFRVNQGALLLSAAFIAVLVGCSSDKGLAATDTPSAAPSGTPVTDESIVRGVLPSSIGPEDSLLQVKLQDGDEARTPLRNGGAIRLADDLMAEIFIDPYPTNTLTAWLDLYLHDGSGEPVKGADVAIDYDMFSMAHGPFSGSSQDSATGHYIFRLDYIMFGPWAQLLQVQAPNSKEEHRLEVTIVAVP